MAQARYWRMARLMPRAASGPLTLGSITFYSGPTEVVGTLSCPATPIAQGVYAQDDARAPGFALQWDMGTSQEVTDVRFGNCPFFEVVLYYSDDAVTWVVAGVFSQLPTGAVELPLGGDNVALLMHCDDLTDAGPNALTMTVSGGAEVSTAQKKFGSGSLYFSGGHLSSTSELALGADDFTIEMWVFPTSTARAGVIAFSADYSVGIDFAFNGANNINMWASSNGSNWDMIQSDSASGAHGIGALSLNLNAWNHIAMVRSGNTFMSFVNGVKDREVSAGGSIYTADRTLRVGKWGTGGMPFSGYIDEIRITKGVGRYTSNFTPASAPFSVTGSYIPLPPELRTYVAKGIDLEGFTPAAFGTLVADTITLNPEDGGAYRIVGAVKEKGTPVNTPLRRRVQLYNQRSYRLIRETWSSQVDGSYAFDWIRGDVPYFVVSFDHTGTYRAVIADNIQATL